MKISDLIEILETTKKKTGDLTIWDIDCFSWNRPEGFKMELAKDYEVTECGAICKSTIEVDVCCYYDGEKMDDRSIEFDGV